DFAFPGTVTGLCKQHRSLPCQYQHFLLLCIAEQYKAACFPRKTHTSHTVKQHTVNPLITPDVIPFLPSAICTVSGLFISTDYYISVIGDVSGS
ncbi:unnamed protein product, partial [Staurois parvus]